MKPSNHSKLGLFLVTLMMVGVIALDKDPQFNISSVCSSQFSFIQKSQLNRLSAKNNEQLSTYLINGNIVQKFIGNDINFFNQIALNIKNFVFNTLKPAVYLSIVILVFLLISQKGQYLTKLSFFQRNREHINNLSFKISPYLLGLCAIVISFSALQAIIIVMNQPKYFSEISCLLENGPKLRLEDGSKQKWFSLNEILQLLSSQQVYFKENLLQLALFVDYRLYLTQNLNLAHFIKNASNIKKAQQTYLSQIQTFITTLQQMVTIQTMEQPTHLKRFFHTYVSTRVELGKIFLGLNNVFDQNFMYPLIYQFEIILFSACLIISLMLVFFAYKKITNSYQENPLTRILRSFIIYLIIIIFILFAVLSLIIVGMFWANNGVFNAILNDEFLDKMRLIEQLAVEYVEPYHLNSGAKREIRRLKLLKKAEFYYNMFNPLAQKDNDYCYKFFEKSLPFLNVQEKKKVMSKLDTKYINSSQLINQTKIAQDTFRRIITSLDKNSTLNRIQYSDYGEYLLKILLQLRKIIFTNFYALRSQTGLLCGTLIVFYVLSLIGGVKNEDKKSHVRIKSEDAQDQSILEEQV